MKVKNTNRLTEQKTKRTFNLSELSKYLLELRKKEGGKSKLEKRLQELRGKRGERSKEEQLLARFKAHEMDDLINKIKSIDQKVRILKAEDPEKYKDFEKLIEKRIFSASDMSHIRAIDEALWDKVKEEGKKKT